MLFTDHLGNGIFELAALDNLLPSLPASPASPIMSKSKKKATEPEIPSDMAATVPMIFVIENKKIYIFRRAKRTILMQKLRESKQKLKQSKRAKRR